MDRGAGVRKAVAGGEGVEVKETSKHRVLVRAKSGKRGGIGW